MPEFRMEDETLAREARFRLWWGIVVLMMIIAILLFVLGVSRILAPSPIFGLVFVFSILAFVAGASILACREALYSAEREMVFVLNDDAIIRKRSGYPDIKITFPQIAVLSEELRWLVVKSNEEGIRIAIPRNVKGYPLIRAELARHHPLSVNSSISLKGFALLAISVLAWIAVYFFHDLRIILSAGIIALITIAMGSLHFVGLSQRNQKRPLLWVPLGFAWLIALLLVYLRMVQR